MLSWYPEPQQARPVVSDEDGGGDIERFRGYNVFYGIAVVCLAIFLFSVLAASVSVWKAFAFAALAALLLSVASCFAPTGWFRRRSSSTAELVVTVTAASGTGLARAQAGYDDAPALVNVLPAFEYERPANAGGGSDEPAAAASSCCLVCSVCLEDVRDGEVVRQVPACRHIFHVECVDMWLHSHRTCPMCRCMILPPPKEPSPAVEEAPHQSSAEELPPV